MAYYSWKSYKFNDNAYAILKALSQEKHPFFLDSSLNQQSHGRYSFLGFDPFDTFRHSKGNTFHRLRQLLNQYKIKFKKPSIPFLAGAVGLFSYDLGFTLEKKLTKLKPDDLAIPDCFFGFYSTSITIDHLENKLYIFSSGVPEKREATAKLLVRENLKKFEKKLSEIDFRKKEEMSRSRNEIKLNSNFTKTEYIKAIKKAKKYIDQGDIYQVNLSQRFQAEVADPAIEIYHRLRRISPSCYSAYFDSGDFQIISSSPEQFLQLKSDRVSTRPMKGTRPRSMNKAQDRILKKELLESAKDKAELLMIVDLERNDLGKVCDYHSIQAKYLRSLEEYSTVFQTTATLEGRLHKSMDRIDLIKACFPGGSITGCPKVRAMEIIEELEPSRRGVYTGSLGYLSFCGNMDLNILIRTILKKDNQIYFSVGSGIVADSQPADEYAETLVKAKAMMQAIR